MIEFSVGLIAFIAHARDARERRDRGVSFTEHRRPRSNGFSDRVASIAETDAGALQIWHQVETRRGHY